MTCGHGYRRPDMDDRLPPSPRTTVLDLDALAGLDAAMHGHVERGVPGAAWLVALGDHVHIGTSGVRDTAGRPVERDSIFRIASMTKPLTAAAALMLVDDGALSLDDPIDAWLPELADRQVLVADATSLDQTEPAERPITVRDLLTFRLGLGYDFSGASRQLTLAALASTGLQLGPPAPATMPTGDGLMAALGSVPLEHQPGTAWRYHLGAEVLGVLVERVTGAPLGRVFAERVTGPLGMVDTRFDVPPASLDRFGDCWWIDHATGERTVWDAADGQWTGPMPFASGGGGLVSTLDDYHRFARFVLAGGTAPDGRRLLSADLVQQMTSDQLTAEQRRTGPHPDGSEGWGFGVGVQVDARPAAPAGSHGWSGGLGTMWRTDPSRDLIAIVLTVEMFTDPSMPALIEDFFVGAFAATA